MIVLRVPRTIVDLFENGIHFGRAFFREAWIEMIGQANIF
jgi:hypothetical protein